MTEERKRILIVDDDRDFVEAIACFLEANGFVVYRAHDGNEGVRLAKVERPDLILMDIMIFVLSAFCSRLPAFEVPEGSWLAHDLFLSKPVDTARLLDRIRHWVGQAA